MNIVLLMLLTYPWPLAPQNQIHGIIGTFGEYRSGPPPHFHNGVDVPDPEGTPVYAVEGGSVTWIERNGFNCGIRVGRFAYIHTIPRADLNLGDYVNYGEVVGHLNYGNHVHFKDGGGASGRATRNALLPDDGFEPFEDPYHTNVLGVWFFVDNVQTEIPANRLSGLVDIVVRAVDTTTPGSRVGTNNGIFTIGYGIMTADTSQFVVPLHVPYVFDTLPPSSALPYTYYQQWSNTSTYYYIVTNEFYGSRFLDTRTLEPGDYVLVVTTSDTRNPPDTFYFPIRIVESDVTPPSPPQLHRFFVNEDGYPSVTWSPPPDSDLAGYKVYVRLNNSRWALWTTIGPDTIYTFDDPAPNNMLFSVKLTAYDSSAPPNESEPSHVFSMRKLTDRSSSILLADGGVLDYDAQAFGTISSAAPYLQVESASYDAISDGYDAIWAFFGDSDWSHNAGIDLVSFVESGKLIISGSAAPCGMAVDSVGQALMAALGIGSAACDTAYSGALVGLSGTVFEADTFSYDGPITYFDCNGCTPLVTDLNGRPVVVLHGDDMLIGINVARLTQPDITQLITGINALIDLQDVAENESYPVGDVTVHSFSDGVELYMPVGGTARVTVFDVSGRILLSKEMNLNSGWNRLYLKTGVSGVHIVRIEAAGRVVNAKYVELR